MTEIFAPNAAAAFARNAIAARIIFASALAFNLFLLRAGHQARTRVGTSICREIFNGAIVALDASHTGGRTPDIEEWPCRMENPVSTAPHVNFIIYLLSRRYAHYTFGFSASAQPRPFIRMD